MKKSLSRVMSFIVSMTIVGGLVVGCQKKSDNQAAKEDSNQLITLTVFSELSNFAGDQTGWFAKEIKDKFNIKLNIISSNLQGGSSKFATMMAAGDLGDIVIFGDDSSDYTKAIKAGLLLDWNKNDLLNKNGQDIVKNYPQAIEKNKTNFGNGSAVYGLGHAVANMPGTTPSEGNTMTYGTDMRWDLYTKLGSPKLNSMNDLLPLLKQMQQAVPKSDSGKPTYPFSMWSDWDGNMMMLGKIFGAMYGYDEFGFLLINANEDKTQDILDPNGYYLNTLKFYNKANQMGMVDPDSISQKFSDVQNKMKDGQVLFSWFPWTDNLYNTQDRVNAGKGFEYIPVSDQKIVSYGFSNYGGNRVTAIGSKTKYPERVMKFIDWLYTPEGIMASNYGPKGLAWDVKDGKPYVTDFGKKALPSNDVAVPEQYGSGSFKDGANQMNNTFVNTSSINPDFKEPYDFNLWQSTLNSSPSQLDQSWRKAVNALTPKDYLVKNNMIAVEPQTNISTKTPDNVLQQKISQIATIIKQDSWKMVFAKNDAEFNALQNDMVTKAKGLGYDDGVKFYQEQAQRQFDARKNVK